MRNGIQKIPRARLEHDGLFEPDILSGPQERRHILHLSSGERRLMLAVLEDAIDSFQKYAHANDLRGRQLFVDAWKWILSSEKQWLFSFENICQAVDMDPAYIREGLKRWRARQTKIVRPPTVSEVAHPHMASEAEDGERKRAAT